MVVADNFNPIIQEVGTCGALSLSLTLSTEIVPEKPALYRNSVWKNKAKQKSILTAILVMS